MPARLQACFLDHLLDGAKGTVRFPRFDSWRENDREGYAVDVHMKVLEDLSLGYSVMAKELIGITDETTCLFDDSLHKSKQ